MGNKPLKINYNMKIVVFLVEFLGWLLIVASPFIPAALIAFVVYQNHHSTKGIVLSLSIATLGLLLGIFWATRIWKKKGTINYLSRVISSPDFDEMSKNDGQKK